MIPGLGIGRLLLGWHNACHIVCKAICWRLLQLLARNLISFSQTETNLAFAALKQQCCSLAPFSLLPPSSSINEKGKRERERERGRERERERKSPNLVSVIIVYAVCYCLQQKMAAKRGLCDWSRVWPRPPKNARFHVIKQSGKILFCLLCSTI